MTRIVNKSTSSHSGINDQVDFTVFGMFLDAARNRAGHSPRDLAHICGLCFDDVKRALAGRRIDAESYAQLCQWIDRDPNYFLIQMLNAKRRALL